MTTNIMEMQSAAVLLKCKGSKMTARDFFTALGEMGICKKTWIESSIHGGAMTSIWIINNGFWGVNKLPPHPIQSNKTAIKFYSSRFDYLLRQVESRCSKAVL